MQKIYQLAFGLVVFSLLGGWPLPTLQAALRQQTAGLTPEMLQNATYPLKQGATGEVTLTGGEYINEAEQVRVLISELYTLGDLNGDGAEDAAVILEANSGGSGIFVHLAAVLYQDGKAQPVASALLGDRVEMQSLAIVDRQITVDLITQGPQDAACCPTKEVSYTYTLVGDGLVRKPTRAFGRLLPFPRGELYGYVNVLGEFAIEPQFTMANAFAEGLAAVSYDGQTSGYINRLGDVVIPLQYAYAGSFSQGLAIVGVANEDAHQPFLSVYINPQGEEMFGGARFAAAEPFSEGLAAVSLDGERYGYMDLVGALVISPTFQYAEPFAEGVAAVQIDNQFGYINGSGQMMIEPQFELARSFHEGLAAVTLNGKVGYINHQSRVVIEPQFDYGNDFVEGRALVALNGQAHYIDHSGRVVMDQPAFTRGHNFTEGLAAVQVEGLFGYIDLAGNMLIEPQFTYAADFDGGIAVVQTRTTQGIIDPTGLWLLAAPRNLAGGQNVDLGALQATRVNDYIPEIPVERRDGFCTGNSANVGITSAWRCTVDAETFDPCLTAQDGETLVCDAFPATGDTGFQLNLTQPLPEPDLNAKVSPGVWMFLGTDSAYCVILRDLQVTVADQIVTHVCSDNRVVLGGVDTANRLWQVEKALLANDSQGNFSVESSERVSIESAWQPVEPAQ
jgi:hypothetical protein